MFYLYSFLFFFMYMFFGMLFFIFYFIGSFVLDLHFLNILGLDIGFSFFFDFISSGFFSCVSFISGIVFLYSVFYMSGEESLRRFGSLVFLFVFSMFLLVFSGNFFVVMLGWDGLGLVSFCLVIFYSNSYSLESGLVTVFSNRIGDVFFISSFLFFCLSGFFFVDVFFYESNCLFMWIIFFGAITKSAQIPFSAWLPAAMAAPTPVSSLVHSSTLVTAGVYVLVRFNYFFFFFKSYFFSFIFLATMVFAGLVASLEKDLKKVVAMSTLSQLGMMIFILSIGGWYLSFIHMIVHAFFKSMLFLSTGSLMGQSIGLQDSRFYGGSFSSIGSFLFFFVSGICLSGFPFFIGFYSKDFIISFISLGGGLFFYYFFILGCLFTVLYSFRLVYEGYLKMVKFLNYLSWEEDLRFFIPVSMLFLKCWILGGLFYLFFISENHVFLFFYDLFFGIALLFLGFICYKVIKYLYFLFFSISTILYFRWFSSSPSFLFSKFFYNRFDTSWLEFLGGGGTFSFLSKLNSFFSFYFYVSLGWLIICVISFSLFFY